MKNRIHIIFSWAILLIGTNSCIEPFEIETRGFEGLLVVDARLTNEEKRHQVLLSRARPFEQDSILPERNAVISVVESSGTTYSFEEIEPGRYVSTLGFGAKTNESYRLRITTSNGAVYTSNDELMPENVPIANLLAKRETNDLGEEGVSIRIDNSSLGNQPRYFRYDYKETYKIIAPNWNPFEFEIIDDVACSDGDAFEVGIKTKSVQDRICFAQKLSSNIILGSTAELEGSDLTNFLVRFINRENYIITHRYSILVNQYTQSVDAHSYYQGLEEFSSSSSVFTDAQPGFLAGNIISESNSDELVIGYFETAAVSSRRIYFNYDDLFPNEPLPDYPIICTILGNPSLVAPQYHCTASSTNSVCDGNCQSPLIDQIKAKLLVFAGEKEPADFIAPYLTLPRGCGDCTLLGSNIKPDFWID